MIYYLLYRIKNIIESGYSTYLTKRLGACGTNVVFYNPSFCLKPEYIFLEDNVNIFAGLTFITDGGKLIFKKNSGAAQGLTVVTGNHGRELGHIFKYNTERRDRDVERDVVIEEDVWIAANVTLLSGVHIGRGANVGANAVVRSNIPPYAVVMGNPAKIVGFNFTPEEIIEHEKTLYPKEERLPKELLDKNYEKYFLKRIKEIKEFTRL